MNNAGVARAFDREVIEEDVANHRNLRWVAFEVGAVVVHVVELENDGVADVFHRDVGVAHVFDQAAGAAHGFDANAVVGALHRAVTDQHVVDASGGFGTDGDAVAMLDSVVFDEDVRAAGFDHDVVVARVDVAVVNPEIGSRANVDGVGVRRIERRADFHAFDGKVVHAFGHKVKHRRVPQREVGDEQAVAAVDDDEVRAAIAGDVPGVGNDFGALEKLRRLTFTDRVEAPGAT